MPLNSTYQGGYVIEPNCISDMIEGVEIALLFKGICNGNEVEDVNDSVSVDIGRQCPHLGRPRHLNRGLCSVPVIPFETAVAVSGNETHFRMF